MAAGTTSLCIAAGSEHREQKDAVSVRVQVRAQHCTALVLCAF